MKIKLRLAAFLFLTGTLLSSCAGSHLRDDTGWSGGKPKHQTQYEGMQKRSQYVIARDGTKLAVTVYLPAGLPGGTQVPAILRQTRYWRDWEFRFPFSLFLGDKHTGNTRLRFVEAGYAWIDADVRGSGASTGRQSCSWCPDEVRDGADILSWIVKQSWSNGKVGATGISYDGSASEMLALNHHPALKAIAPRFASFDVFTDVAFPGGIQQAEFTKRWAAFNRSQDNAEVPAELGAGAGLAVVGPWPVDEDADRRQLRATRAEHQTNLDVHAEALKMTYRDDISETDPYRGGSMALATAPTSLSGSIGVFSSHTYSEALQSGGVPTLSYSGWWDGAYQHGAIKRFLTVHTPGSQLILGPWDHGGWQHIEPFVGSRLHDFDHDDLLIAFFDAHLRGDNRHALSPKPVAYYTMGEGKWKFAETWPPLSTPVTFSAAPDRMLENVRPELTGEAERSSTARGDNSTPTGEDVYTVDNQAGTGKHGRWFTLLNPLMLTIGYPNREEADRKILTYTSAPLTGDMEVTGHPLVTLRIATTAPDGFFFVYLEDVNEEGEVAMITEGQLRGLHRALSSATPPTKSPVPYRTFESKDGKAMTPGVAEDLRFDLLPTSYLFRKGHRIRLAIAGADRDNFAVYPTPATWTVSHGATRITLPVVASQNGK